MANVLRRPKSERRYTRHRKKLADGICEFCEFNESSTQVCKSSMHFWVVANKFPYTMWDSYGVKDHLMIIPKRHINSWSKFTPVEQKEFFKLASSYESKDYSIYTRPPKSKSKSVAHQHTHLIKLNNRSKKLLIFLKKPHILFMR